MTNLSTNLPQVIWQVLGQQLHFEPAPAAKPLVMGIVNTTSDSFSDGGQFLDPADAVTHAVQLVDEGANIIDIGGQSTRPGALPVSLELEIARVIPVIEGVRKKSEVLISIDTSKAEVARRALASGAQIINDVTALCEDPEMLGVAANCDAGLIVMHMLGTPKTMQTAPTYDDVVADVTAFLGEQLTRLTGNGVARERIAIDPGIGFGKTVEHNLRIIRELAALGSLGRPICLGASRKHFIGKVLNRPIDQRVYGSVAVALAGYFRGAHILRVHDVAATRDAIEMTRAIERYGESA